MGVFTLDMRSLRSTSKPDMSGRLRSSRMMKLSDLKFDPSRPRRVHRSGRAAFQAGLGRTILTYQTATKDVC